MAYSKSLSDYDDIRAVLDAALKAAGARYKLNSTKEAITFRARAHAYRKLLRDVQDNPALAATPYDRLKLTLDDATVVIEIRDPTPAGRLTTLNGEPLRAETEPVDIGEIDIGGLDE